jgi:hypothetical protein
MATRAIPIGVLSAFWIAGVGAVTWATFPAAVNIDQWAKFDPQPPDNKKLTDDDWIPLDEPPGAPPPPSKSVSAPDRSAERLAYVQRAAILGVAPPVLVLVVGAALTWVARGFRT